MTCEGPESEERESDDVFGGAGGKGTGLAMAAVLKLNHWVVATQGTNCFLFRNEVHCTF